MKKIVFLTYLALVGSNSGFAQIKEAPKFRVWLGVGSSVEAYSDLRLHIGENLSLAYGHHLFKINRRYFRGSFRDSPKITDYSIQYGYITSVVEDVLFYASTGPSVARCEFKLNERYVSGWFYKGYTYDRVRTTQLGAQAEVGLMATVPCGFLKIFGHLTVYEPLTTFGFGFNVGFGYFP